MPGENITKVGNRISEGVNPAEEWQSLFEVVDFT